MTEITHLSQLNTMFHGYEESLFNADGNLIAAANLYPMSPEEIDEQDYRRMCLEDQRAEADVERQNYYDDRFDNDNEDALREQDEYDREHETGEYDYRNDY